jgi:SAM-dependent methyltransferase
MISDAPALRQLLKGMRATYARGGNAMEYARSHAGADANLSVATLIAYDLQAGSYIAGAKADPLENARKCSVLAGILGAWVGPDSTILDAGCGEATTLAGIVQRLPYAPRCTLGFDISWSRCAAGRDWLAEKNVEATLFMADLFGIPLADASVDVVFTSHALEPNGGREAAGIRELLRIARRAVVLVEPIYEFAGEAAQARMRSHGYIRNLRAAAESVGATILEYRPIEYSGNKLNPSGLMVLQPSARPQDSRGESKSTIAWRCPLTHAPLREAEDIFCANETGIVYPVMRGIPLLRAEHAVVASRLADNPAAKAAVSLSPAA